MASLNEREQPSARRRPGKTLDSAHSSAARRRAALWLALAMALPGCRSKTEEKPVTGAPVVPPKGNVIQEAGEVGRRLDLIDALPRCEVRHRGLLLDLGSPSVEGLEGWNLGAERNTAVEREGATWLRVTSKSISYRFVLEEPQQVFLAGRIKSLVSKSAAVVVDGKTVGTLVLTRGQTKVVSTPVLNTPLAAGSHQLTLRFAGASKDGIDTLAEVDWLRVGFPDDDTSAFAAPTHADILQNLVTLGGVPHRSVALRVPSAMRCPLGVPQNGRLRTAIALVGSGEGEAEVRFISDGKPTEVLRSVRVQGAEKPIWTDLDLPIGGLAGRQGTLELAAVSGTRSGRMLIGDPRIVAPGLPDVPAPKAKAVIVVVVSSVNPERLPPWAPDRPLPTFDALAREGVIFERHRAPSTVVSAVMASLMTGLSPRQHGVEDGYARIPEGLPTLSTIARDASVHTAMFTAHPASFAPFGFARGWDRFTAHSPVSPATGTRPIDDLIAWIGERGPRADKGLLAVVHTRGIHPPFDVSPGEFAQMPPHPEREYAGPLDPRRAGQVLEKYRPRKRGVQSKWGDMDNLRLNALIDGALVQTDRSLSNLIDALRKAKIWNDTLLIVTSDVAAAVDPNVLPFASALEPTEETLRTPLYVHFPGGVHAGERVQVPVSTADLTLTALTALGLGAAAPQGGEDLRMLVEQERLPAERAAVASVGERLSVRWGDFRLLARDRATPQLCDLTLDPRCERDVLENYPLLTQAMWRQAFEYESQARPPRFTRPRREPATIDPETAAALAVWGKLLLLRQLLVHLLQGRLEGLLRDARALDDGVGGVDLLLELSEGVAGALPPQVGLADALVHAHRGLHHLQPLLEQDAVAQLQGALVQLAILVGLHLLGRLHDHHVVVELLVELPHPVPRPGGPERVGGAHRVGVGRL